MKLNTLLSWLKILCFGLFAIFYLFTHISCDSRETTPLFKASVDIPGFIRLFQIKEPDLILFSFNKKRDGWHFKRSGPVSKIKKGVLNLRYFDKLLYWIKEFEEPISFRFFEIGISLSKGTYFDVYWQNEGDKSFSEQKKRRVQLIRSKKNVVYELDLGDLKNVTKIAFKPSQNNCVAHISYIRLSNIIIKTNIKKEIRYSRRAYPPCSYSSTVTVPENPILYFGYGIRKAAWDKPGDGVTFIVSVEENKKETVLFKKYINPKKETGHRKWFEEAIDISNYTKRKVTFIFETKSSAPDNREINRENDYAVFSTPIVYSTNKKYKKPNIILIGIDALRADHLSCYGYNLNTSPNIDQKAQQGVLFEEVISQCSWTLPSFTSIVTSLYPFEHKVESESLLDESIPTIQKIFRNEGYYTAAFTNGGYLTNWLGWDIGFDLFVQNNHFGGGNHSFSFVDYKDQLFEFLSNSSKLPFYLFLHSYDCHAYYDAAPKSYQKKFIKEGYKDVNNLKRKRFADYALRRIADKTTDEDVAYVIGLYDSEILYLDSLLKELFDLLEKKNILDNTYIILTSDHGEEFKDHGSFGHNHTLFRELVHVPLIIFGPEIPRGLRIKHPVETIDIFPTILALSGLENKYKSLNISGTSLIPLMKKSPNEKYTPSISKDWNKIAIRTEDWTYIEIAGKRTKNMSKDKRVSPKMFLFDRKDYFERFNLIEENKTIAEKLKKQIKDIRKRSSEKHTKTRTKTATPDEKAVQELKSLGYLN